MKFWMAARTMAAGLTPPWVKNSRSSAASIAWTTRGGMAEIGTNTRRSVAYSAKSLPSPAWTRVMIGG